MRVKFDVRKLCVLAVLAALSVVLVWLVHFPVIPIAPWLEYDAGDLAIFTGTFLYGPVAGVFLTLVASAVQAVVFSAHSGFWGFLMHFVSTSAFCLIAGGMYRFRPKQSVAAIGMVLAVIATTLLMIPLNILITPLFSATTTAAGVAAQILTVIIPFNLIKFSVNAVLAFALWRSVKALSKKIWGEKGAI